MLQFSDVFLDCTSQGTKIKTDAYADTGKYAIVDQGQSTIAGYTDLEEGVFTDVPAIIFGDHTRVIKYIEEPFFLGADGVKLLKAKVDNANYKYLYYALKNAKIPNTGYNRHFKWLKEVQIAYPDADNQAIIVETLERIERIIDNRQRQLAALDTLIKARFVEMFGHQSNNEKDLPYGKIDDVADIYLGLTHTPEYVSEGVMFISAKNTSAEYLDLSDVKYISREEFESAPTGSKPKVGDVLFSRVGSNLGHPVILEEDLELCTFVSLGFLRTKGQVLNVYLKHWMKDDFFIEQVKQKVVGGGQPNLNTGWLKEFKIIIPPMEQQIEFSEFCKQVDKSKVVVQKALDEAQLLFDSLMQEYFG